MNYYRENWYKFGVFILAALAFYLGFGGTQHFDYLQLLLIYSFMALLVHQFEEYALPGGFPAIFNIAMRHEKQAPERFPLNTNQVLVTNVFLAYPYYIIPIFFPNLIWMGIAQMLFGIYQIIIHGVMINLRLKSLYNPGLGAVILLHIPLGIYYMWYVATQGLATTSDFVIGFIVSLLGCVVMIVLPIRLMGSRESEYPFSDTMMYGYAKEKLLKMKNT